jgi:hypothetical protein
LTESFHLREPRGNAAQASDEAALPTIYQPPLFEMLNNRMHIGAAEGLPQGGLTRCPHCLSQCLLAAAPLKVSHIVSEPDSYIDW